MDSITSTGIDEFGSIINTVLLRHTFSEGKVDNLLTKTNGVGMKRRGVPILLNRSHRLEAVTSVNPTTLELRNDLILNRSSEPWDSKVINPIGVSLWHPPDFGNY